MFVRVLQLLFAFLILNALSCTAPTTEKSYANLSESTILAELGKPQHEFVGHYGAPPLNFTNQFSGEIKTVVFMKNGGSYYISFEKRAGGWISICSSWLPDGAEF